MTQYQMQKAISKLRSKISEFSMLSSLVKSMDHSREVGLMVDDRYYKAVKSRRDALHNVLEPILKQV